MTRRTFGTILDHNIPEKTLPQKTKPKQSNQISLEQTKTNPELAKKTHESLTTDTLRRRTNNNNKKAVSFPDKIEGSTSKISPDKEGDAVKTPARPPFSVEPGTPLSAENCSGCGFDRLETSSYWLGQIKSAENVSKHFVSAAFFRLAHECKAKPARNLRMELKNYLDRHCDLCSNSEWTDVYRMYGMKKKQD